MLLVNNGGSGGAETILTSKYSGSTSSVSKMVDFGPPGAEKLIFSDKTSACLNDCSPKHIHLKDDQSRKVDLAMGCH